MNLGARRSALAATGLALVLATAGCGTKTINSDETEAVIAKGIEDQTQVKDPKVECPDEIEAKAGSTFQCMASGDGDTAPVKVTQKDDQGNINWEIAPQKK